MIQEKLIQILKESLDKIHPENINAFFDIIEFSKRHLIEFGVVSNY
jgi:CRISPR/Cas system CSM-associated protein Csm2 small subunit